MKDLKHLIYFENLLLDANNELVRQARADGQYAMGYTCFHMPEVLLNLGKCFSVRLRAPRTGSMEIATYYMSNSTCEYSRALLERAMEGGYRFLDALAGVDACECMNRCMENIELLKTCEEDEHFFFANLDVPFSDDDSAVAHYCEQLNRKIMEPMRDKMGIDISDAAIRKAVDEHNALCRVLNEIGEFRKLDIPTLTGYEYHILTLVSYCCPHDLILDKLRETLAELKTREPDKKKAYRAKVVVVGSEIDDPDLISLIEESGALVVADRFCYGSVPGRAEITLAPDQPAFEQVCRRYLQDSLCPRLNSPHKVKQRYDVAEALLHEYHADGIIYEQMKFCTYWSYERALASHVMTQERGIPTLSIDRPYMSRTSGQLRTRVQAFIESLEIKKIKAKKLQQEVR
ncbi:MAG: 2-hydroxyacyl-CoA dehydratase family protein [Ruthenibacterium sp.]